jgi:hypothetical protein
MTIRYDESTEPPIAVMVHTHAVGLDVAPWVRKRILLQGREATVDHLTGPSRGPFGRIVAARPTIRIHSDLRSAGAAKRVVDGQVGALADEVPQRGLDSADGGMEVVASVLAAEVQVRHLGEMLDIERATADEVRPIALMWPSMARSRSVRANDSPHPYSPSSVSTLTSTCVLRGPETKTGWT